LQLIIAEIAAAMLLNHQLDSAAYYIRLAKSSRDASQPATAAVIFQTEADYNIQSGAFAKADSLLQKCSQLIIANNLPVNAAPGLLAPDFLLAQLRIKQNRLPEAIDLLSKDIATWADQFVDYKFREGVPSRHIRIALIAIFTDHWIQSLDSNSA
jgi:tetratricopeptide (TPR) repeat protein